MAASKKILMVVTNVYAIDENHPTGLWLEEFAVPYIEFLNAGYSVVVASPKGGKIPLDPNSLAEEIPESWQPAMKVLDSSETLASMSADTFDALILPGGHGPMFDLAVDAKLAALLNKFHNSNKIIGAVCHGPAALVSAVLDNGQSLIAGKKVTGFTNEEERTVQLDHLVPFLLEDKLKELGGTYVSKGAWQAHVVVDGNLITGQNPQSSALFAKAIIDELANLA
ncbi:MAG: type 1 glutamine amidotransferase domain-containing protein [Sporomusaceae bacterium]|nr:type 1 glutamine amidotransferase domain-containing protein [Sporomusaceae bacterium]